MINPKEVTIQESQDKSKAELDAYEFIKDNIQHIRIPVLLDALETRLELVQEMLRKDKDIDGKETLRHWTEAHLFSRFVVEKSPPCIDWLQSLMRDKEFAINEPKVSKRIHEEVPSELKLIEECFKVDA